MKNEYCKFLKVERLVKSTSVIQKQREPKTKPVSVELKRRQINNISVIELPAPHHQEYFRTERQGRLRMTSV